MNTVLLEKCLSGAWSGTMTFGETIGHMLAEKVEWYSANLIFGVTTHYYADLSHHQSPWPNYARPEIAGSFDREGVIAAIRAIQQRQIIYPEFIRQIAAAGTVYYTVHLQGQRAIYFGRNGEFHVEEFPRV